MHMTWLIQCACAAFDVQPADVADQAVVFLDPLEAMFTDDNTSLEVWHFLTVVDTLEVGVGEISLADARALEEDFDVGEEVGRLALAADWWVDGCFT